MTSEELDKWGDDFEAFHARLAGLFARSEPREQMAKYAYSGDVVHRFRPCRPPT